MIVRLSNDSTIHCQGWRRGNIDVLPPLLQGSTPTANYLIGNRSGLDTYTIDVYTGLQPDERRVIDLRDATPMDYFPQVGYPLGPQLWGGIEVAVAGVPLEFLGAQINGAAIDGHWRGRITEMLVAELWVTWYPDDPSWSPGEIIITASNPSLPDTVLGWIPPGMRLQFDNAIVLVPGRPADANLMSDGDWLADGQSRLLPLVLCWQRHGGNIGLCRAIANQQIQCNALQRLHAAGNPRLPANFDAKAWNADMLPGVIARQHDWFNSPLDPAYVSGAAGAQGAQSLVGGPGMADPAAVGSFYVGGLDGSWPLNHLEQDGSQLDWKNHPNLRLYYGRVNRYISSDTLGKTSEPSSADTHGYAGLEDEHYFDWTAITAARYKGTPGTQWMLRSLGIQWLHRWVTEPPGNWLCPNRGIGWMSFMAAELYRNLEDRELAEAIKERWQVIFATMIHPLGAGGEWWSWKRDDRIGPGWRAIPWQAAVLALGVDWAGEAFDHGGARGFAAAIAAEFMGRTYFKDGDRWRARDVITQDGSDPGPYIDGYAYFGTPFGVAAFLRNDPGHVQAREIWDQLVREAVTWQQAAWLAPLGP